jgi:hypothetical protein
MPGFNIQGVDSNNINPKKEFHRSHRWVIESLGVPGMQPEERLYAKSIQLPSLTFDEEKIKSGASVIYKIAKKANWQPFTIKFYDTFGMYKGFKKWQDKIWTPAMGIGLANEYKSRVILALTDGEGEVTQRYTAIGAYPKSITHGELSYESSDVKLLTVAYSYDWATIELMDNGGTTTGGSRSSGSGPQSVSGN